ncbi:MAG: permease-like cell division protein FtsX [Firmicutes bacterium]|nr:permease-like cell division protein FtsX [Bacillota bacterium]MBR6351901.1 permease-like cell division protein FtsX [Bacillota bacterium]
MIKNLFYSLKQAFIQMWRNRGMTLASLFSITAMLLILGLFFFLTVNVSFMTESVKEQFDTIEVFLEDSTSYEEAQTMMESLMALDDVSNVEYISKKQAMAEFKERWGENGYLLDGLSENPLPNSLRVTLSNLQGGELTASICRNFIGVEDVRYYQTEINKVLAISDALQKAAMVIIIFLVIVSVVVVSNTVKLTVMARRDEIMIMKYVGATNWFIRGPMLAEGMLIGMISAVISLGIIWALYEKMVEMLGDQAFVLFSTTFVETEFMMFNLVWIFLALGLSIGAFGSIISMRRYLNEA